MKAKKLLAALVALVFAVPGAAYAATTETSEIVEGHTVFAAVVDDDATTFAAIAGIAAKRTTVGGVLWFNDAELIPTTVASELAAGRFVIATEAGDDAPSEHMDANYTESYQFKDPNDRVWLVDRYTYEVCTVQQGGASSIVPCDEGHSVNDATVVQQDLDNNGVDEVDSTQPIDVDGDGSGDAGPVPEPVDVVVKSLYVVTIGDTQVDSASTCGAATGKDYNFVLLVRMDSLRNVTADGEHHGASSTASPLAGNSHASTPTAPPDHTHDTAQVDLWYSDDRPAEPGVRNMLFADSVGSTAGCHAH